MNAINLLRRFCFVVLCLALPRVTVALDSPKLTYDYFKLVEDYGWGDAWGDLDIFHQYDHGLQVYISERIEVTGQLGESQYWWNSDSWDYLTGYSCNSWFNSGYWWNQPWMPQTSGWFEESTCGDYTSGELLDDPDFETETTTFEKCDVSHEFWTGSLFSTNYHFYHRFADTGTILLHPSRVPQTIIFTPSARAMTWDTNVLVEWWVPGTNIPPQKIKVGGKQVDCNGRVAIQCTSLSAKDVSVSITNAPDWYKFSLPFSQARYVEITRSYHPDATAIPLSNLQGLYNGISVQFATDHDTCIPDSPVPDMEADPAAFEQWFTNDSVPVYIDFKLLDPSGGPLFPNSWIGCNFTEERYNNITIEADLDDLLDYGTFALLKQVSSLPGATSGEARSSPESYVVEIDSSDHTHAHEWAHIRVYFIGMIRQT